MDERVITYKAKIVAYQDPKKNWPMTIHETKELVESGKYEIEFIMPLDLEPTIIIKPL